MKGKGSKELFIERLHNVIKSSSPKRKEYILREVNRIEILFLVSSADRQEMIEEMLDEIQAFKLK